MLDFVMTASLEDVVKTDEIAFDVCVRVCDAITDTGLSCEIDNHGEVILVKKVIDNIPVCNARLHECPVSIQ